MTHWPAPVLHWQAHVDPTTLEERLAAEGELLTRWPAAPFETSHTDCVRLGQDYWVWQPGVGGIRFNPRQPEVLACPAAGVDRTWFEDLVARSWLPAVYQVWGCQVLHASAVRRDADGTVAAIAGPGGAGKSTLAFALARRDGWTQIADDTLAFSREGQAIALHPLRNEARLRPATAAFYGRAGEAPRALAWPVGALSLAAVYFVSGDADPPEAATIERLAPAESYVRLLEQAHAFTLKIPEFNQQLMRDYLDLTATVPAFALRYRKSFDELERTVDVLCAHAASHGRQNTASTT